MKFKRKIKHKVKCQICGKEFSRRSLGIHVVKNHNVLSKYYYDQYMKKEDEGLCKICGNPTTLITLCQGYHQFCSKKCMSRCKEWKRKISRSLTGENHPNFGNHHSKETCEKISKSHLGMKNPMYHRSHSNETKRKISKSMLGKMTGKNNPNYGKRFCESTRKKMSDSHIGKLKGLQNSMFGKFRELNPKWNYFVKGFLKQMQENNVILLDTNFFTCTTESHIRNVYEYARSKHNWKCAKCNTIFKTCWNNIQQGWGKCPRCYSRRRSIGEILLGEYIKSLGFNIITNSKNIVAKELDIYIPELKIGIEYDGIYWHSKNAQEDYHNKSKEDPKMKQLIKTELCAEQNIQLIHIFDDEWLLYQNTVQNLLKRILIENYDLLDNESNMITVNRRFSKNPKYYQDLGYELKIIEPKLYLNKEGYNVWDAGYLQLKKEKW